MSPPPDRPAWGRGLYLRLTPELERDLLTVARALGPGAPRAGRRRGKAELVRLAMRELARRLGAPQDDGR